MLFEVLLKLLIWTHVCTLVIKSWTNLSMRYLTLSSCFNEWSKLTSLVCMFVVVLPTSVFYLSVSTFLSVPLNVELLISFASCYPVCGCQIWILLLLLPIRNAMLLWSLHFDVSLIYWLNLPNSVHNVFHDALALVDTGIISFILIVCRNISYIYHRPNNFNYKYRIQGVVQILFSLSQFRIHDLFLHYLLGAWPHATFDGQAQLRCLYLCLSSLHYAAWNHMRLPGFIFFINLKSHSMTIDDFFCESSGALG